MIREGIRAVQQGRNPQRVTPRPGEPITTYSQNTILRVPRAETPERERLSLRDTGRRVISESLSAAGVS
jgi:hypothetical protein